MLLLVLGFGLALNTINASLGFVNKALALTLSPRPGQTQCHCFIVTRINADEFGLHLFSPNKFDEQFSVLKPLMESVYCVPASSAPVEHVFVPIVTHHAATSCSHV